MFCFHLLTRWALLNISCNFLLYIVPLICPFHIFVHLSASETYGVLGLVGLFHDIFPQNSTLSNTYMIIVLENKESLQHIKIISLISSPISFLIFLPDFLNIFHFNISWLCGMCSPILAYIFISFVIKSTQWNKKQCIHFLSFVFSPSLLSLPFYSTWYQSHLANTSQSWFLLRCSTLFQPFYQTSLTHHMVLPKNRSSSLPLPTSQLHPHRNSHSF